MPKLAPDSLRPVTSAARYLKERLGEGYSRDSIYRRIDEGRFIKGKHYHLNHSGRIVIDCDRVIQDLRLL